MLHLRVVMDRNVVGALLLAGPAVVARLHVAADDEEREGAAAQLDRLDQIARGAGCGQHPDPRPLDTEVSQHPGGDGGNQKERRELEDVARGTQRADVPAPEHPDEEAARQKQDEARHRHPEHDLALESRGDGIVGIELLAEELARRERVVEDREEQDVLHGTQHPVEDAARRNVALDAEFAADAAHPLADGTHRTEIAAEELREENDAGGQHQAHHDLEHRHRAGERIVHQIGPESLQTAERTVGLHVDGFVAELRDGDRRRDGDQHAPLQDVFQVVGSSFHRLFVYCVLCVCIVRPGPKTLRSGRFPKTATGSLPGSPLAVGISDSGITCSSRSGREYPQNWRHSLPTWKRS